MKTEDKVEEIISRLLNIPVSEIAMSDRPFDLGMDSLDMVEIIMTIEEELYIEISDADAEKFITIKDLVDYVERVKHD
jgi:acyl carrier protein